MRASGVRLIGCTSPWIGSGGRMLQVNGHFQQGL